MLDVLFICLTVFLILTFFYKQAVCEFRINQLEWSQRENAISLLHEKVPLVLRGIPALTFWTQEDVQTRSCYSDLSIFQDQTLGTWLSVAYPGAICPWKYPQAEQIANVSGLPVWTKKWLHPLLLNPFLKLWMAPRYHCWAGKRGLHKTFATWTCILPVEGDLIVTILPETAESALPVSWVGCFPSELTAKDTPFVGDLKYIDIVVRPGTCLMMPPHWFVSWVSSSFSMVCTVSYHTPVSLLAFHASPKQ
jgi:hypothetical protein